MSEQWLVDVQRPPAPRVELVCFPHAGGQPAAFAEWPRRLPPDVALRAVQLPGRAQRLAEPPVADRAALIERMAAPLAAAVERSSAPVIWLGHSMGAVLAFELCRALSARRLPRPALLVVAAHRPPHRPLAGPNLHSADDEAMLDDLRRVGATPPEVIADAEFMALLMPMIRADYAIAETWCPGAVSVDVPLLALGGWSDDEVPPEAVEGWRGHTTAGFEWAMCEGDHFFLHARPGAAWATVRAALERIGDCGVR